MRLAGLFVVVVLGCSKAPAEAPSQQPAASKAPTVPVQPEPPAPRGPWRTTSDTDARAALTKMAKALAGPKANWATVRPFVGDEFCFGDDDSDLNAGGVTSGLRCASGAAVEEAADQIIAQLRGLSRIECADSLCVERAGGLESWYAVRSKGSASDQRVYLVGIFDRDQETTDDRAWEGADRHAAWQAAIDQRFGKIKR